MKYLVLGLVVACGSPHAGAMFDANAGDDAAMASDARPDAPPDAMPTPPCATTVDLDGDGLGWQCDPVEHIALPNAPHGLVWMRWLADDTFATHVGFNCSGYACADHAAIEVRPDRAMIRRSDSGLAEDAWLKSALVGGPCIDAGHAVWWSASSLGMTGTVDPAGAFQPVTSPLIADCFPVGNTTALVGMNASTSVLAPITSLAAPGGGALDAFATADFGNVNAPTTDIAFAPAILAAAGKLTATTSTLVQAHPGDLAPSDVIVDGASTATVDSVTKLDSNGPGAYEPPYALSAAARFVVKRSGNAYVVAISAAGVDWARLPRTDMTCSRWPNEAVACTAYDSQAMSLVVVRGSTAIPVFDHELPNGGSAPLTPAGDAMRTIQWGPKIWVIDPANHASVLASGLANPHSAVRDDVAMAVGVSATGDLVLERYHTAIGREEITIQHGVDVSFVPTVILTADGDAIVGGTDDTYVVAATGSAAVHLNLPNVGLSGFSRGDSTVVVAGDALYAYDELAPGPRLTMLVAPDVGLTAVPLDPDHGAPTDYFAFGTSAWVGRIVYTGATPSLVQAPCAGTPAQARLMGRDHAGVPIALCGVDSYSLIFELPASGPKLAAHFEFGVALYLDWRLADHPVVAWGGQSVASHYEVICLASHPDRCWRIPGSAWTRMNVDSVADTFSVLSYGIGTTAVDLWIMRPLGPGEDPQPLP